MFTFPKSFNPQPILENDLLRVVPLSEHHRASLTAAAEDPGIWAGHPASDRYKPEVFDGYFTFLLGRGSAMVVEEKASRTTIGCSVYYCDPDAPSRLSIGFTFLVRDHWGGQTNRQLKALMLGHIFDQADEAWFHIAPTNIRSQVATQRLGAVFTRKADLDLGTGSQPWFCYCLTKDAWKANA